MKNLIVVVVVVVVVVEAHVSESGSEEQLKCREDCAHLHRTPAPAWRACQEDCDWTGAAWTSCWQMTSGRPYRTDWETKTALRVGKKHQKTIFFNSTTRKAQVRAPRRRLRSDLTSRSPPGSA